MLTTGILPDTFANMKRVELKRIVEFLWKGSPAEEKTPFASQGSLPSNGSYSKSLEADDNKKAAKELSGDEDDNVETPMSIPRKMCFAMSFNVWILYFLVLGWILPCRHHECGLPNEIMERSLRNIRILTNMEPMNKKGLPSMVMIGYSEGKEWKLAALATYDATIEWNNTLPFVPQKIQCNFENTFDSNRDGIEDCLLSGVTDVYAFNASDGYVFWHRNLFSEEGGIFSGFHPTTVYQNKTYLIGTYGDKMVVLNSKTGNKTMEIVLPCFSPIDIRLATVNSVDFNTTTTTTTTWGLVCNKGDEIEAWGFDERDVLRRGNLENDSTEFTLLFRLKSAGSIDLRRDVTSFPGGPLILSSAGRVAMVTRETTAWERYLPPVTSITAGNFSWLIGHAVAVALINETDTVVQLLRLEDGIFLDSITLPNRQAQMVETVTGDKDLVLLKSAIIVNSTEESDRLTEDVTNFVLIDFNVTPIRIKEVANETSVIRSSVSVETNGETDLLILRRFNGTTMYVRHLIRASDTLNSICHAIIEL